MSDAKISIVVPVYNTEQNVSECIESILGQTHKNIELILVDDGSSDNSGAICDSFSERDPRIKVVHTENRGVSAARNLGVSLATGDYLAFSDSDDTMRLDMLEFLLALCEDNGAEIAVCGYMRCENGTERAVNGTGERHVQSKSEAMRCIIEGKLYTGSLCTKLFSANVIKGLTVPEDLKINEDVYLCYLAFNKASTVVFADEPMYNYIIRSSSSTSTTSASKCFDDVLRVTSLIYEDARGSEHEIFAFCRYANRLIGYVSFKNDYKKVRKDLLELCRNNKDKIGALARNSRIKYRLVKYCPHIYMAVYKIYDKIRKPNWDV